MEIPLSHLPESLNSLIKYCSIISIISGIVTAVSGIAFFYWSHQKENIGNFVSGPRTPTSLFVDPLLLKKELQKSANTPIQVPNIAADLESEHFGAEMDNLLKASNWKVESRGRYMIGGAVTPRDITIINLQINSIQEPNI